MDIWMVRVLPSGDKLIRWVRLIARPEHCTRRPSHPEGLAIEAGVKGGIYGQVASVAYGPAGVERDGMPSKLEWIAANHQVKLIWAAIVFASGLLLGFGRWFSKSS